MRIKKRQSLLDVAMQQMGNVESAFEIAALNNFDITDNVEGCEVTLPNSVADSNVVDYYAHNDLAPATELRSGATQPAAGIGAMAVGYNFIVSKNNFKTTTDGTDNSSN